VRRVQASPDKRSVPLLEIVHDPGVKRFALPVVVAVLLCAVFIVRFLQSPSDAGRVDGQRLLGAARAYEARVKARGEPVPSTVSLAELLRLGLLKESDVAGLRGFEVLVHLQADEKRPGDWLVRARLPDQGEMVVLVDGSVQQVR